jgi:hypothetical protein
MLMVAYLGAVPVLGLPGCVMYHKTTIFDLVLPQVLTGQTVTRPMIAKLGMGGTVPGVRGVPLPELFFRNRRVEGA